MYSKLFSTRPNTAVLLSFAPLHLPFVPSLFFRVNFTLNEIPLGLLAAQQRDVNYDLCSLYFFSPFSPLSSLSLSLSLSLLCLHWLRNMCVNRNFFTECIVHLHFCARARDPWPNWHCSVTCCGISFEFVSDSDPLDCILIWNSRKFPPIFDQCEQRYGNNISGLFALEMRKFWNFHSWKYIFPVCFIFRIEF